MQCDPLSANIYPAENTSSGNLTDLAAGNKDHINISNNASLGTVATGDSLDTINKDGLQTQDSFGRWMTSIITNSPDSVLVDDQNLECSISTGQETSSFMDHHQSTFSEQIFTITDVSPASALSTEETKVLFFLRFTSCYVDTYMVIYRSSLPTIG